MSDETIITAAIRAQMKRDYNAELRKLYGVDPATPVTISKALAGHGPGATLTVEALTEMVKRIPPMPPRKPILFNQFWGYGNVTTLNIAFDAYTEGLYRREFDLSPDDKEILVMHEKTYDMILSRFAEAKYCFRILERRK